MEKCKFSGLYAPRVRTLGVDDEKEVGRECFLFPFSFCFFSSFFSTISEVNKEHQAKMKMGPFFFPYDTDVYELRASGSLLCVLCIICHVQLLPFYVTLCPFPYCSVLLLPF